MGITTYTNYIGGAWTASYATDQLIPSINPYTGETWAKIIQSSPKNISDAISSAEHTLLTWRSVSGTDRCKLLLNLATILEKNAEKFSVMESADNGKVIRETFNQMLFAARNYRFYAGFADKLYGSYIPLDDYQMVDYAMWEPVGVCALLTGWNSPLQLLSNKLAPALAAGNTVVIKPSELASITTLEFMNLIEEAGFPPGVVNVVTGDSIVGAQLCSSRHLGKISFTGSTETGKKVMHMAAENLTPLTLELGGKSPNIIFGDANYLRALDGAIAGVFGASGQTCMAGSRLLVEDNIYSQFLGDLVVKASEIKYGNPLDPETEMGPLINLSQRDRVLSMVKRANQQGGKLLTGGFSPQDPVCQLFVLPTIIDNIRPEMEIFRNEVFGPVVATMPFNSEEEAISIANDSDYGLVAGVWTQNISCAHRMSKAIRVGTVWINTYRMSVTQAPAGGSRSSGFGKERGWHGLLEFIRAKNIMIDYSESQRDPFSIKTQ